MRAFGHAVHPMLVVFPLGLLATSLVWDIVFLVSGNVMWAQTSFWTIVAGLAGALIAAVPGFVDWLAIPRGSRAWRIGAWHLVLNLIVVTLFVVSAGLRLANRMGSYSAPDLSDMVPGWIALGAAVVSGWLGGELVERLGVAVDEDANVNAPSSLRRRRRK
jgi:uncharacterized membrane protein